MTQIAIAIFCEAAFASYMGPNYGGAHRDARLIFARRCLISTPDLLMLAERRALVAEVAKEKEEVGG